MKIKSITILMASFLMMSCVSAVYVAPENLEKIENTRVVNKNFDDTWSALIAYAGTSFFSIDDFEKNSGLMTLNFSSSNPEEYITGGFWKRTTILPYEGDYVGYLEKYYESTFSGKMNIVVQSIDDSSTRITINARYIYTSGALKGQTISTSVETWSFDTSGYDIVSISSSSAENSERKLMPTYKAENTILDAIDAIISQ